MPLLVNADIGGTNARMQMWELQQKDAPPKLRHDKRYAATKFAGLEPLLRCFLADVGITVPPCDADAEYTGDTVEVCCCAICGPVDDEARQVGPVLPEQGPTGWGTDAQLVQRTFGKVVKKVCLINDFVAVGYGLTEVNPNDVITLHEDKARKPKGVIGCVGAGTGLGEVFLTWSGENGHYQAHPSEGGMADFLAHDEQEWRLRQWLLKQEYPDLGGHVTVESVVSGPGLANCYEFLKSERSSSNDDGPPSKVARVSGAVGADPAEIATRGLNGDALCCKAIDLMLTAYGAELRQAALRFIPYGGLYIAGGIAPKLKEKLPVLVESYKFGDKLMGEFIRQFPLYLVVNEDLGLLGARVRAQQLMR